MVTLRVLVVLVTSVPAVIESVPDTATGLASVTVGVEEVLLMTRLEKVRRLVPEVMVWPTEVPAALKKTDLP